MLLDKIIKKYLQSFRVKIYKGLNNNKNVIGNPIIRQPALFVGIGKIFFGVDVTLGYYPSPHFYNGSIYIESRSYESEIVFGDNIIANNNLCIVCDRTKITVGSRTLIGVNVTITDSDFHGIHPENRNNGKYICKPVIIEENVFIGNNCTILKGVTIGENSIVANGSIVIKDVQSNTIVGGNPAKLIKSVFE